MRTTRTRRIIHYKRAVLTSSHAVLHELLAQAMAAGQPAHKVTARQEAINPDRPHLVRFINRFTNRGGMVFGQMVLLERGRGQAYITEEDDAEFFTVDSLTPDQIQHPEDSPEQAQKRRQFLNSMLYFGVLDNHLVVVQSQALKSRDLEGHLNWLLQYCTGQLQRNTALILQDKPTEKTFAKVEKSPVKSVKLGAPVGTTLEAGPLDVPEAGSKKSTRTRWMPQGMGVDVLRALLGQDWFNRLDLKDSLDEANLQVSLTIEYLRKTTQEGQRMLDNIATSLRHADETDVEINLKDGGRLRGQDLRLSGPISVDTINGLLVENNLYHEMHAWLLSKVNEQEIDDTNDENT